MRHLLLVGAQRCGSTYLASALDAHPRIAMACPPRPEPKVFCDAERSARGLAWYHGTWFAHADGADLLGDKSTSYLEDAAAPRRAAEMLGDVEVVVVLREPVARAVSNWRFSTDNGLEDRDLDQALRATLAEDRPWDPAVSSVSPFDYLRRGRYVEHLAAWTAVFPDTSHVVFLEELLAGPDPLAELFADLGVDPADAPPPPEEPVNESSGDRSAPTPELRETLEAYFAASNAALAAHLGRELPW